MYVKTKLAAVATVLSLAVPAQAATILGQFSFTGFVRPIGSTNMGTATGLDFYNVLSSPFAGNDGGIPGTILSALGSTGVFAGITCVGTCGFIQDLPNFSVGPISSFVDIASVIYFDLGSITSVTNTMDGAGGSLKLIASGTFRIAGFDNTPGVLTMTTQGDGLTSFSATALSAVPEPANWAMMIAGVGMIGGLLRASPRARRNRTAIN